MELYIASEVVASVAQAGEAGAQEPDHTGRMCGVRAPPDPASDTRSRLMTLCIAGVVQDGLQAEKLAEQARKESLSAYQKLTRDSLAAATWLKRYAEALLKGDDE